MPSLSRHSRHSPSQPSTRNLGLRQNLRIRNNQVKERVKKDIYIRSIDATTLILPCMRSCTDVWICFTRAYARAGTAAQVVVATTRTSSPKRALYVFHFKFTNILLVFVERQQTTVKCTTHFSQKGQGHCKAVLLGKTDFVYFGVKLHAVIVTTVLQSLSLGVKAATTRYVLADSHLHVFFEWSGPRAQDLTAMPLLVSTEK